MSVVGDATVARARRQKMGVEYLRVIFVTVEGKDACENLYYLQTLMSHDGTVTDGTVS